MSVFHPDPGSLTNKGNLLAWRHLDDCQVNWSSFYPLMAISPVPYGLGGQGV